MKKKKLIIASHAKKVSTLIKAMYVHETRSIAKMKWKFLPPDHAVLEINRKNKSLLLRTQIRSRSCFSKRWGKRKINVLVVFS